MWLAQLPGRAAAPPVRGALPLVAGASGDRMLRELTYAVEVIAAQQVLVLGIEDIHWSDRSTLDWIATLAPRTERARILIVATMRPPEPGEPEPPALDPAGTLRAKHLAIEVALTGLDAVGRRRVRLDAVPGGARPGSRARAAGRRRPGPHRRQSRSSWPPCSISSLERGVVVNVGDGWDVTDDLAVVDLGVPETIRPVIDRQVARLPTAERHLLEIAERHRRPVPGCVVAEVAGVEGGEVESTLRDQRWPSVRPRFRLDRPAGRLGVAPSSPSSTPSIAAPLYDGIPPRAGRAAPAGRRVSWRPPTATGPSTSRRSWPSTSSWATTRTGRSPTCSSRRRCRQTTERLPRVPSPLRARPVAA